MAGPYSTAIRASDFGRLAPGGPSNMGGAAGMVQVHAHLRKGKPVKTHSRKGVPRSTVLGDMSSMKFTDSDFWRSHGKAPRGQGGWAFRRSAGPYAYERDLRGPIYWKQGTLTQAKKSMRASKGKRYKGYMAVLP